MTTVLCTLYNSLYLDKGLVLYDSLCECAKDFKLYVLCMDDKCYEVLSDLNLDCHIPIRLSDFEEGDYELLEAKANRPMGEYCWTCSSSFIKYVLKKYNEPICTYIDADMFFYNDPQILIDEMLEYGKSVMVTPHRFPSKVEKMAETVGKYCVEFNTFLNNYEGLKVLEYWRSRCLECCENIGDGIHWGDQKYLEELVDRFPCVHVCMNIGAGVAPWNIIQYKRLDVDNNKVLLWKNDLSELSLIFYHFQSVKYLSRDVVDINIQTFKGIDIGLVDMLYYPYLRMIETKKKELEDEYGVCCLIMHHPADKKIPVWKKIMRNIHPLAIYGKLVLKIKNVHPYILCLSDENRKLYS